MARITPEGVSRVVWQTSLVDPSSPTVNEFNTGVELTSFITPQGLETPETVNEADISDLSSRRDLSVPSTISGSLTGNFWREKAPDPDTAWDTLVPDTNGFLMVLRFGGGGANNAVAVNDPIEVYPCRVANRSNSNLQRGTALSFSSTFTQTADTEDTTVST